LLNSSAVDGNPINGGRFVTAERDPLAVGRAERHANRSCWRQRGGIGAIGVRLRHMPDWSPSSLLKDDMFAVAAAGGKAGVLIRAGDQSAVGAVGGDGENLAGVRLQRRNDPFPSEVTPAMGEPPAVTCLARDESPLGQDPEIGDAIIFDGGHRGAVAGKIEPNQAVVGEIVGEAMRFARGKLTSKSGRGWRRHVRG